jgi:hypothetical protein
MLTGRWQRAQSAVVTQTMDADTEVLHVRAPLWKAAGMARMEDGSAFAVWRNASGAN